jgi:hypothetical protein
MTARALRDRAKPARETLFRLREVEGLTLSALAVRFGCSEQTVWSWCRSYGIRGRAAQHPRPQPAVAPMEMPGSEPREAGAPPLPPPPPQMRIVGSDPREMVERALAAGWRPTRGETRHAARQWSGRPVCRDVGV